MFNKDFYPTPPELLNLMQIECNNKTVYEPSAGSGNIITWLKQNGAKSVIASELHPDLAIITKSKADQFIGSDFLKIQAEQISHIDLIVMNPPFSAGVQHVKHAWDIAPGGCEIISLINSESLRNDFSSIRREVNKIIENYGFTVFIGNVFTDAERETDVTISLIKLFKPKADSTEFEGFFMDEEESEPQQNGIMRFNAIRDVVNRYVGAVQCWDKFQLVAGEMDQLTKGFNVGKFSFNIGYDNNVTDRETFKRELQKKAWHSLFAIMNMQKFVTSGVMKDINTFVNNQSKVPFTMRNVYKMFDIILGTSENSFNRSLIEAMDKFTMHTHENRYNVEGWKTNSGHLLNEKFIVGWMLETSFSGYLTPRYNSVTDKMEDLIKVLCWVTATDFETIPSLYTFCSKIKMQAGEWYDWGFFQIKGFKKGTLHCKFKNLDHWALLNKRYAKAMGFGLPEKFYERKSKSKV
jgi:hypothetical protein